MSPAPRTRAEKILPGDHDALAAPQRRTHYNQGCTHALCREAFNDYQRERRARLKAEGSKSAAPTLAAPNLDAAATPLRELTGTRVTAQGATRRIQGLMRIGHSPVAIARASQVGVDAVWWLALGRLEDIDEVTHRVIDRAFRQLRTQTPEPAAKSAKAGEQLTTLCRQLGADLGWAGAFDWDDIDWDDKPAHGYSRGEHERRNRLTRGGAA